MLLSVEVEEIFYLISTGVSGRGDIVYAGRRDANVNARETKKQAQDKMQQ